MKAKYSNYIPELVAIFVITALVVIGTGCSRNDNKRSTNHSSSDVTEFQNQNGTAKPSEDFDGPPGFTTASVPEPITGTNMTATIFKTCVEIDCKKQRLHVNLQVKNGVPVRVSEDTKAALGVSSLEWLIAPIGFASACQRSGEYQYSPLCTTAQPNGLQGLIPSVTIKMTTGETISSTFSESSGAPASGPVVWLNADQAELSLPTTTTDVSNWPSAGNQMINFQIDSNAETLGELTSPTLKRAALNGHAYLHFDGNRSGLTALDPTGPFDLDLANTIVVVFRNNESGVMMTNGQPPILFSQHVPCYDSAFLLNTDASFRALDWPSFDKTLKLESAATGAWMIVTASYKAFDSMSIYRDGALGKTQSIDKKARRSHIPLALGFLESRHCSAGLQPYYSKVDIAEFIVFDRSLVETERRKTECYLSKKYGIATNSCN